MTACMHTVDARIEGKLQNGADRSCPLVPRIWLVDKLASSGFTPVRLVDRFPASHYKRAAAGKTTGVSISHPVNRQLTTCYVRKPQVPEAGE